MITVHSYFIVHVVHSNFLYYFTKNYISYFKKCKLLGSGHLEGGATPADHERYLSVIVACTPASVTRVGAWRSDSSLSVNSLLLAADDMATHNTPSIRLVINISL